MTVGEKIQFYRKRAGLSQEELGQQLLVSRQTVSLWETGQTMPTLDNLSRLRTIFGVSVDEILSVEDPEGDEAAEPQEMTAFYRYQTQELRAILWHALRADLLFALLALLAFSFAVVSLLFTPVWPLFCVVLGSAAVAFWQSALLIIRFARVRGQVRLLRGCQYALERNDEMLRFVLKERETVRECLCVPVSEISMLWQSKAVSCMTVCGNSVYVARALLTQSEGTGAFFRTQNESTCGRKRLAAGSLWVASVSLLLAWGSALVLGLYGAPWRANVSALVLFVAVLPALTCALIGIFLRHTHMGWKKNVVVGFLVVVLTITGGVGTLISALPRPVYDTQHCLGMVLPPCENVVVAEGGYTSKELFVYYRTDFYFDDEAAVMWEEELSHSTGLFDEMGGFADALPFPPAYLPSPDFGRGAKSFLLFDVQTQQKAKGLEETGYHEYLLLAYFPDENMLSVAKFNLYIAE